jgi:hypothetical protein
MFALLAVLAPCLGLAVNSLAHIALMRLLKMGMLKAVFASFFLGLVSTGALSLSLAPLSGDDPVWIASSNLLIFSALGYCYFHFINMGTTGRRFRIMYELLHNPQGLTLEEIKTRYNSTEMLAKRIRRLLDNGQITETNGVYRLPPSPMKFIGLCFFLGKRIVYGKANLAALEQGQR